MAVFSLDFYLEFSAKFLIVKKNSQFQESAVKRNNHVHVWYKSIYTSMPIVLNKK